MIEGFDTAAIHLPKLDVSTLEEPIILKLRDNARGERFSWPTPLTARPSSHFGPRWRRWHYGLDLALPTGEPIYAAFDGVVRISKLNRSYGNLVIIHHANGLETYYAHMSKRNVVAGQQVKSGDIIGLCGNTGRSFGSHLHFEIRYKGNALNPEDVIDCSTHDLISEELTLTSASFRKVAKSSKGGSSYTGGGTEWYRVRNGDTLEKIARRNGTTITQLCKLNGISRNKVLHPGDRLRVSGKLNQKCQRHGQGRQAARRRHLHRRKGPFGKIAKRHGKINNAQETHPRRSETESQMRLDILTLFPNMMTMFFEESILKRAQKKGLVEVHFHDLHDYSLTKYGSVDDYPYGGAAGMVMAVEPLANCIEGLQKERPYDDIIYTAPDGEMLSQPMANQLSLAENLMILCGHYKGVDERVREHFITKEISIGDYVLTGGELATAVIADAVIRLVPGVLGDEQSALGDSFQDGLVAPPEYTRPPEFRGWKVPDVLLSGNHAKIEQWRMEQAIARTKERRPHLLKDLKDLKDSKDLKDPKKR